MEISPDFIKNLKCVSSLIFVYKSVKIRIPFVPYFLVYPLEYFMDLLWNNSVTEDKIIVHLSFTKLCMK